MNNNSQGTPNQFTRPLMISTIVVIAMFALSAWTWFQIPAGEQVPVHWGIDGQPDRYGSPLVGLFMLPLVSIALIALLYFIPRLEPRKFNLEQSIKPYRVVWVLTILFLGALHIVTTLWVLGYGDLAPINKLLPIGLGILFIGMGNFMGKVRSNYIFGIRTPWTLSSELSWNKTHRLGGKLFLGFGLILLIDGLLFAGAAMFPLTMIGVFAILAVVLPYSYWIWKNDPAAQTA